MGKRIFAFLLCLLLSIEMIPFSSFAAAYPAAEKVESDEIIIKEDGSKSRLVKTVIYPAYDYTKVIDGVTHYFLKVTENVSHGDGSADSPSQEEHSMLEGDHMPRQARNLGETRWAHI